jgi:acyl dehydratase
VTADATDALREELLERIGKPLSGSGPSTAPDPVNVPMIRHWVDAFDDRNPIYLDDAAAVAAGYDGLVAPPAMLQTWTMARPRIEGIRERGGSADDIDTDSPIARLAAAGYRGTLATNSELEFARYLRPGDHLESKGTLDEISELKATALGVGYFVTWINTYTVGDEVVGQQRFRIFKFDATRTAADLPPRAPRSSSATATQAAAAAVEKTPGPDLPPFDLDVTATVVVAGAIASRDFMPVHHDRDYARAQGAPDLFMNILTTTGYVTRYVTDWAGPHAVVRRLAIRLGGPAIPGLVLHFTGAVTGHRESDAHTQLEVTLHAANDLGDHATGTVELTVPTDQPLPSQRHPGPR